MAAEALQALNRILQYRQQSERADVQEALSMMEFAAKKRVTDYTMASKMIEDSSKYNAELQIKVATDFIHKSNLDQFANAMTIDPAAKYEEIQKNIEDIADDLRDKDFFKGADGKGKITFSIAQSEEIASALWAFKTSKDPSSIMSLAEDIGGVYKREEEAALTGVELSNDDVIMIRAFKNLQAEPGMIHSLNQAAATLQNQDTIMKERLEMFHGDFKFDEELISVLEPTKTEKIGKSLNDMSVQQLAPQIDDLIAQQEAEGEEDSFSLGPFGTAAAGGAAVYGEAKYSGQFKEGEKIFRERLEGQVKRNVESNRDALSAKEFKDKYKMTKAFSETKEGKALIDKRAIQYARRQTFPYKGYKTIIKDPYKWATGKGGGVLKTIKGSAVAPWLAPTIGGAVGGVVAGEKGGIVGEGIGGVVLANQPAIKVGRTFINFLASKFPTIAGKAFTMAMADSPALGFGDIAALGLGISEIWGAYEEWQELYGEVSPEPFRDPLETTSYVK